MIVKVGLTCVEKLMARLENFGFAFCVENALNVSQLNLVARGTTLGVIGIVVGDNDIFRFQVAYQILKHNRGFTATIVAHILLGAFQRDTLHFWIIPLCQRLKNVVETAVLT